MPSKTVPIREKIAKKIRFLLQNHSITIRQMAERIGVPSEYVREVADGHATPTPHLLLKICRVFNLKLDFFGPVVEPISPDSPKQESQEEEEKTIAAALPFTPESRKRKPIPVGVLPQQSGESAQRKKKKLRKFDLAELAAHHQALLECLIEKKILSPEAYQKKVDGVRKRAGLK